MRPPPAEPKTISECRRAKLAALMVNPNHQNPLGGSLSLSQRFVFRCGAEAGTPEDAWMRVNVSCCEGTTLPRVLDLLRGAGASPSPPAKLERR